MFSEIKLILSTAQNKMQNFLVKFFLGSSESCMVYYYSNNNDNNNPPFYVRLWILKVLPLHADGGVVIVTADILAQFLPIHDVPSNGCCAVQQNRTPTMASG